MNDYVLLTDSSADLTDALVKELGVEVLPLSFTMRNKTYRNWPDNREIDPKDFYRQLREGEMATTSAVNVSDFTETIEPHLKEGRDVLVVAFSSGLSGQPATPPRSPPRSSPSSIRSGRCMWWTPCAPPWARACWCGTPPA